VIRGAVCVRCGGFREDYQQICPSCGHRPEGEGLLVAWLLSDAHLDAEQLARSAERIQAGEAVRPSQRMIDRARRALGGDFVSDPGLGGVRMLGLGAVSVVLTPLVGLVLWAWWRRQRPRAAVQALAVSLPVGLASLILVVWLRLG